MQNAYLDLVRSNLDVLSQNITLVIETLVEENKALNEQVFGLEKLNDRLATEARLARDEQNRLSGEVIRLLDIIAKMKTENLVAEQSEVDGDCEVNPNCDGCNYTCPPEYQWAGCPEDHCCKQKNEVDESEDVEEQDEPECNDKCRHYHTICPSPERDKEDCPVPCCKHIYAGGDVDETA